MMPAKIAGCLIFALGLAACAPTLEPTPTLFASSTPKATQTIQPEVTAVPTMELDDCLLGTWQVEPNTLAAYLMAFISPDQASNFELLDTSGDLQFTFTEDFATTFSSGAYSLIMVIESPGSNFNETRLQLSISASGSSKYALDQGKLLLYAQDYSIDPNLSIPVHITATSVRLSHIALTPTYFVAMQPDADFVPPYNVPSEGLRYANYQCDRQVFSLSQDDTALMIFMRVQDPDG